MLKRFHRLAAIAIGFIAIGFALTTGDGFAGWQSSSAAIAQQIVRSEGVWRTVYEQIPDFPRENQYISKETGKVATEDTLVGRLIRYHLYVKGRPPSYRLDWKLTLADYLGLTGALEVGEYPGATKLKKNPAEGDVAAIRKLNRAQRDALVQALVNGFSPQSGRSPLPTPPSN
jgi:hypothetical protein